MSDEKKRPACLGKNCREMIEEKTRPRAQKKICTQEATKKTATTGTPNMCAMPNVETNKNANERQFLTNDRQVAKI